MMESQEVKALATVRVDQPGLGFSHTQPELSQKLRQSRQCGFRFRLGWTHDDQVVREAGQFAQVAVLVLPGLVQLVQVDVGQ